MRHSVTVLLVVGGIASLAACGNDGGKESGGGTGATAGSSSGGYNTGGTDSSGGSNTTGSGGSTTGGGSGGTGGGDTGGGDTGGSGTAGHGGTAGGAPNLITEADCGDLPGAFDGKTENPWGEVCLTIDWETNPCFVKQVACEGQSIFFEWEPGSYFNVKFYDQAEPYYASAGTVYEKIPNSTAPASVLGMPEGELVLVRVTDKDGVDYDINFRLDGDVLTLDYIIQLF